MRRLAGVVVAAAALAGAGAGQQALSAKALATAREDAREQAKAAQKRAHEGLFTVELQKMRDRVANASQVQQLRAEMQTDVATIKRDLHEETWWQSVRDEFPVYRLVMADRKLTFSQGMDEGALADDPLVASAKTEARAEVVMGKGWPYLAAAAPVFSTANAQDAAATLVLARPLDAAELGTLAGRAGTALLVTDGAKTTFAAGPPPQAERLRQLVAQPVDGDSFVAPDATWAAALEPIGGGVTLWTYADTARAAADAAHSRGTTQVVLWAAGGAVALLGLLLGFRRGAPPAEELSRQLETTKAELERLKTGSNAAPVMPGTALGMAPTQMTPTHGLPLPGATPPPQDAALARTAALASEPQVFGRYQLIDRLGEGGMAEVYTAVTHGAEGFRRMFVVKRLRAELARDPEVVGQFIDEAKLASTLVHSNIVPVFDFGKVGEEYFMAQEYILGRDLAKMVARSVERQAHALPVRLALYAGHEVLKALEYAHSKLGDSGRPLGIVHRDVSPSNVLVSSRGEVKLFDFGIVKAEGRVTKTQHGIVKGNVSFMSPEQARGLEVDARADLFSLGLVLYYALTGRPLYEGSTTYELLVKAATGPGEAEKAKLRALPDPVPRLLLRALDPDPAARFQNAAEFAAALAPHAAGGAAEIAKLVALLFTDDFRAEEARLSAPRPIAGAAAPAGTRSFGSGS